MPSQEELKIEAVTRDDEITVQKRTLNCDRRDDLGDNPYSVCVLTARNAAGVSISRFKFHGMKKVALLGWSENKMNVK